VYKIVVRLATGIRKNKLRSISYLFFTLLGTPLKMGKNWHSGTFLGLKTCFRIKKKYLKKIKKKKNILRFNIKKGLECQFWSIFNGVSEMFAT
jgi:hypothetical protein